MRFLLRKFFLCVLLSCCGVCSYALTLEYTLRFDDAGGAEATMEYTVPEKAAGFLEAFFLYVSEGRNRGPLDEPSVRSYWESRGEGVTLESYNVYTQSPYCRVVVRVSGQDARQMLALSGNGVLTDSAIPGDVEFRVALPVRHVPLSEGNRRLARELSQLLDGVKFILRLQTPTAIIQTTGEQMAYDQCCWKLSLEELLEGTLPEFYARW